MRLRILRALVLLACVSCGGQPAPRGVVLATTTSVENSGLLDVLVRAFQQQQGLQVRSHLVGSGLALRMLSKGDVDVVISHAPTAEASALRDHPRWGYRKIMFNDFVIAGPLDDPAHVKESTAAEEAMRRVASSNSRFISRGDASGTHEREQQLWDLAGSKPRSDRLVAAGAGMGSTLRIASETASYTLTDRATFEQLVASLRLAIVFEGGPHLLNTYAVVVNPDGPHATDALRFADWLSDGEGRGVIESYRIGGKSPAFHVWPDGRPRTLPNDVPR